MAVGDRNDPYGQFNFLVELDGLTVAGFTEVGGLASESDVGEYREGSEPARLRKIPGLMKYTNITLKRGYTSNSELWDWRKSSEDGATERRDGSIVLLDESRTEALRWNFRAGWISKYEGPALNSSTSEAAIESIEIAHEGLEMDG